MQEHMTMQQEHQVDSSALECLVMIGAQHGFDLSVHQIVHDNALSSEDVSIEQLVHCARKTGLKAKAVRLDWNGLGRLKKALPVIVRLKNGYSLVLVRMEDQHDRLVAVLSDPKAPDEAPIIIDRLRFEEGWTGDVVMLRRDYDIGDEEQPFGFGLISSLIFRERRLVRDLVICAFILSIFALAPIVFFQLLSGKVLYYRAMNTF